MTPAVAARVLAGAGSVVFWHTGGLLDAVAVAASEARR